MVLRDMTRVNFLSDQESLMLKLLSLVILVNIFERYLEILYVGLLYEATIGLKG